jgi:hypothetical protein
MKNITKWFATIKQAERYQMTLYSKWNFVNLLSAPRFSEDGNYTWQVSRPCN